MTAQNIVTNLIRNLQTYEKIRQEIRDMKQQFEDSFRLQRDHLGTIRTEIIKQWHKGLTYEELLGLFHEIPHFTENHDSTTGFCKQCDLEINIDETGQVNDMEKIRFTRVYLNSIVNRVPPRLYAGKNGWIHNI